MLRNLRFCVLAGLATAWLPAFAVGQSGTWVTSTAGSYNWSDAANWQNGVVADGAGNAANFTTAGPDRARGRQPRFAADAGQPGLRQPDQ